MHHWGCKQCSAKMAISRMSPIAFFLLFVLFISIDASPRQLDKEIILINVTAVGDTREEIHNLQINFNISVVGEQIFVNDIPVKLSGVTRLACQALLLDSIGSSGSGPGVYVTTVARVLVRQWPLESDPVVELLVFNEEIIEVEGRKVQQPVMYEVNILMNENFQKLRQSLYSYPISESMLFSIPRENDVVVTDPNLPRKVAEQDILHTTSHYPLKQAETTQEETAAPGKLPETPLRMDPAPMYEEDTTAEEEGLPDKLLPETPLRSESMSSYSAMCQWVEKLRGRLRRFWTESLPLFFLIMWVVVVGVVGSAVIVKILDVFFPSCEHKGILALNPVTLMPEEEKHCLLENTETEPHEEKKP